MIKLMLLFDALVAVTYIIALGGYLIATVSKNKKLRGLDWFVALVPFFNIYAFYSRVKSIDQEKE